MTDQDFCGRAVAYLKPSLSNAEAEVVLSGDDEPIVTDLHNGLLVVYLVDQGKHFEYVNRRHLIASGLTEAELHQTALGNLAAIVEGRGAQLRRGLDAAALVLDGNFEASLILIDWLWEDSLAHLAPNGFVVAIPARDVIAFCDAESARGIAYLRQVVQRLEGASRPLTPMLYRRDRASRTWRPYAD
ncbi:MAG TPA: DUF1444 family protein [Dongiaceae bacterium]|jgi:uncharacterized protein YtpQ (UPF0354 family)